MLSAALSPIVAWRVSRLPLARFVPLAVLIAWAATGHGERALPEILPRIALAFMLVAQFRLWDDIVDRGRDRVMHPERVLARAVALQEFVLTCTLLGAVNTAAVAILNGLYGALGLLALDALLAAWYRLPRTSEHLHLHGLLLKYPAFVLLLAPETARSAATATSALALYCGMCAFELLDRPPGRALGREACLLLALHALCLAACAPLLAAGVTAYAVALGTLLAIAGSAMAGQRIGWSAHVALAASAAVLYIIQGGGP